jgi:DNA-binding NtrC family response regulator
MDTQPPAGPALKPRVLFVDDEPRVLTTMRVLFRSGYQMYFADSGQAALDLLKTQPVDVIVSDQRMPGMTGIEMLRAARELNASAMRILLTGYADLNAIIGSINEGEIFRFVNKPWSNEDLTSTVARAAAAARLSAAVAAKGEPAAAPALSETPPAILVMDDDPNVPHQVQAILGSGYRVLGATSMDQAVALLESDNIGVVMSDTRVQNHPVVNLIGTLKQHRPELVSVILTERADAGAAIDLINQGQIYRLITKPIHESACKITVSSALRQHHRLTQTPELHQRYEVERTLEPPPTASATGKLLDRIRSLRSWVTGRA